MSDTTKAPILADHHRSTTRMRDWKAWEHIHEACDLLERFDEERHPSLLELAQTHVDIAQAKMIGAARIRH
jgi:hypothetical protein